jgi:hypothetical protein
VITDGWAMLPNNSAGLSSLTCDPRRRLMVVVETNIQQQQL